MAGDLGDSTDMSGPNTGGEDCFNNADDDGDGLVDCADPNCQLAAECVPVAPNGFQPGTLTDQGTSCPAQYQAFSVSFNQGIHQGTDCNGCMCNAQIVCHSNIYDYAAGACPGAPGGNMFQVDNTYCQTNGALGINYASGKVKIDPMTTTSITCTGGGTATPPALTWDRQTKFCQTNLGGGGCQAGNVCAPKATKHCALASGNVACPSGYLPEGAGPGVPWNTGYTEGRTCSGCSGCGSASGGSCAATQVTFYTSPVNSCLGTPAQTLDPNNSYCALPETYDGAKVVGAVAPTCSGTSMSSVTGTATETGPQTLCCK